MQKNEAPLPFDEFRVSQEDALLRQRERLRDEAVANEVLAAGREPSGWRWWDDNVLELQS